MPEKADNERGKLQERLGSFGREPESHIWEALEGKLAKKHKKRPVFWWLAAFMAVMIGGSLLFWRINEKPANLEIATSKESGIEKNKSAQDDKGNRPSIGDVNAEGKPEKSQPAGLEEPRALAVEKSTALATQPEARTSDRIPKVPGVQNLETSDKELMLLSTKKKKKGYGNIKSGNLKLLSTSEKGRQSSKEKQESTGLAVPLTASKRKYDALTKSDGDANGTQPSSTTLGPEWGGREVKESSLSVLTETSKPEADTTASPTVSENSAVISRDSLPVGFNDSNAVSQKKEPELQEKGRRKVSFSLYLGIKAAAFRQVSINQNQPEAYLKLSDRPTPLGHRLAFDAGSRISCILSDRFSLIGWAGFSYLGESLRGVQETGSNLGYTLRVEGDQLLVAPRRDFQITKLEIQQVAGFIGLGMGYKLLPRWQWDAAIISQWLLYEWHTQTIGNQNAQRERGPSVSSAQFSIRTGLNFSLQAGKVETGIGPFMQWFRQPLFTLQPGTWTQPLYGGIQVLVRW